MMNIPSDVVAQLSLLISPKAKNDNDECFTFEEEKVSISKLYVAF